MGRKGISEAVIKRLPKYYRQIKMLDDANVERVSSSTLAEILGITASQVRQDFYNFGGFGQQGYGYDVKNLRSEIAQILGLDKDYNMIIVGAGHIGQALTGYKGFAKEGFHIKALFDINVQEKTYNGVPVLQMFNLQDYLKENQIDIAVIATQADSAEDVARELIKNGIKSIWNFAPIDLKVPKDVVVENISMSESLFVLSYRSKNRT
ncbi:MAG: redox-sensing transcriptional repressor Rex [Clostridiales bacterium]|nr:redox-sensing transcriptional repressor Rex [Clostridiales bacterium]